MEGRERAACEARLNALRNIQTLLDAATLQFQQYLVTAPSVILPQPGASTNQETTSDQPGPSTSAPANPQRETGEAQLVE